MSEPINDDWWTNHDDLTAFGSALVETGMDARELQYYYEKPWKWSRDRAVWVKHGDEGLSDVLDNQDSFSDDGHRATDPDDGDDDGNIDFSRHDANGKDWKRSEQSKHADRD